MISRLPLVALLLMPLAGCMDGEAPPEESLANEPLLTGTADPSPNQQPPTSSANVLLMQLSNCSSFLAAEHLPNEVNPGSAPAGWQPSVLPVNPIHAIGYDCQRISLGPYERGPVRFLLDGHWKHDPPANCSPDSDSRGIASILNVALISDEEIADFLKATYGLPAIHANFAIDTQSSGPATRHHWTWGPPDQEPSTLTFVDEIIDDAENVDYHFYWVRGTGVGVLDLRGELEGPAFTHRVGHGMMQGPMLAASVAGGTFTGTVDYYPAHSRDGTFLLYSDPQCEYPESP